jgi:hypothetical protein
MSLGQDITKEATTKGPSGASREKNTNSALLVSMHQSWEGTRRHFAKFLQILHKMLNKKRSK